MQYRQNIASNKMAAKAWRKRNEMIIKIAKIMAKINASSASSMGAHGGSNARSGNSGIKTAKAAASGIINDAKRNKQRQ